MHFKIVDPQAISIPACVVIPCGDPLRAFYISISTVFSIPELRVFQKRPSGQEDDVTRVFFPDSDGSVMPTAKTIHQVLSSFNE